MNWRVPDFGRGKGPNRIRGPKGKNKIKFKKKKTKWWEFFKKKKTSVTRATDSFLKPIIFAICIIYLLKNITQYLSGINSIIFCWISNKGTR